jgi:hypothetical protein
MISITATDEMAITAVTSMKVMKESLNLMLRNGKFAPLTASHHTVAAQAL